MERIEEMTVKIILKKLWLKECAEGKMMELKPNFTVIINNLPYSR